MLELRIIGRRSTRAEPPRRRAFRSCPADSAPALSSFSFGGTSYFHLELMFGHDALIASGPAATRDLAYQFSDGRQFEIYIRPELIPVPSSNRTQGVIVRMPRTNPNAPNAERAVQVKQRLFAQLMQLREHEHPAQSMVIELNPYIKINSDDPQRASLTQCNVFLRHAHAGYIDRLGPLPP